jgi:uncharacterized damage-inducible protein DinB
MNSVESYRRWFEYEKDVHQKTIASLEAVASELRSLPAYQKAVDLFAHIVAARRLWLFRFGIAAEPVTDIFPQQVEVESLTSRADAMQTIWASYLEKLDDAELARVFEYQALDGKRFRNTIEDILTQLFGHSWYHRGQIAQLVRSMGAEPAVTDFVYWCREAIPETTVPEENPV